jgi:hypothetical protein
MSRVLPTDRVRAVHESAHASAFILAGWPPAVVRTDFPDTLAGSCRPDWDARDINEQSMRDLLIALLQGPIIEGVPLTYDRIGWPLDVDHFEASGCAQDAAQLNFVGHWLGLTAVDWLWLVEQARTLSRRRDFRTLLTAIADRLEVCEMLTQPELQAIADRVLGARS